MRACLKKLRFNDFITGFLRNVKRLYYLIRFSNLGWLYSATAGSCF